MSEIQASPEQSTSNNGSKEAEVLYLMADLKSGKLYREFDEKIKNAGNLPEIIGSLQSEVEAETNKLNPHDGVTEELNKLRELVNLNRVFLSKEEQQNNEKKVRYEKLSNDEILLEEAKELISKSLAETHKKSEALEASKTKEGKGPVAKFIRSYRSSRKVRLGVAAGSALAAVALTTTGIGAAGMAGAGIVRGANAALRGYATYKTVHETLDAKSEKGTYRQAGKLSRLGIGKAGELQPWTGNEDELKVKANKLVESGGGFEFLVKLESPHAKAARPEEQRKQIELMSEKIREAQAEHLADQYKKAVAQKLPKGPKGRDLIDLQLPGILKESLNLHLGVEKKVLAAEEKKYASHKKVAVALAALMAATGLHRATGVIDVNYGSVAKDIADKSAPVVDDIASFAKEHGKGFSLEDQAAAETASKLVLPTAPDDLPTKPNIELHRSATSTYDGDAGGNPELYTKAEVIKDDVNGNETAQEATIKHLRNIEEYEKIHDPQVRQRIQEQVAGRTLKVEGKDGSYWRTEVSAFEDAIKKETNPTPSSDAIAASLSEVADQTANVATDAVEDSKFIMESADTGSSVNTAVDKHLSSVEEYHNLETADAKQRVRDSVVSDTLKVQHPEGGLYWRISADSMEQAITNEQVKAAQEAAQEASKQALDSDPSIQTLTPDERRQADGYITGWLKARSENGLTFPQKPVTIPKNVTADAIRYAHDFKLKG